MPHVEGGACPVRRYVVRIYESGVAAVGRVVDGVAVRVSHAQRQIADSTLRRDLQCVVDGVGLVFELRDIAEARISGAERVRVVAAGDPQIGQCRGWDGGAVTQRGANGEAVGVGYKVSTIGSHDRGPRRVRIVRCGDWDQLVRV